MSCAKLKVKFLSFKCFQFNIMLSSVEAQDSEPLNFFICIHPLLSLPPPLSNKPPSSNKPPPFSGEGPLSVKAPHPPPPLPYFIFTNKW